VTDPDTLARNRFLALSLLRVAGAVLIVFGMVAAAGRLQSIPKIMGIILVLIGAIGFALLPKLLARRWRTPR
jgi:drug/metabolite transporter (DMT)-like permease